MLGIAPSCKEQSESGGHVAVHDINAVLESHAGELMQIPGVTGVAVGELDDGTPCLVIFILEDSARIKAALPDSIEGHPVQTFVSGEIKPMEGDSGG
jgi:hypothetical protein